MNYTQATDIANSIKGFYAESFYSKIK